MTRDDRNDRLTREPDGRQRLFNAPFLALALPLVLLVCYASFLISNPEGQRDIVESFALNPILVRAGQWEVLFTYAFLHVSLLALLINVVIILIFGATFANAVGNNWKGALSYFAFFELCCIASGLAFCWVHGRDNIIVLGASGAASGFVGAAMRSSATSCRHGNAVVIRVISAACTPWPAWPVRCWAAT